jgi:signal transduction histidine kinase/ligand-binding sensor domain-containing protein
MNKLLILLILVNVKIIATAQQQNYTFTNYTTAQGLPDNIINGITQDSRGFIWIATAEGLSRFDGKNFKNFFAKKNDSIITPNAFSNIYEYKKGHLLLNNNNNIVCFNTYSETFYWPKNKMQGYLSSDKANNGNTFYINWLNKSYICNKDLDIIDSVEIFKDPKKDQVLILNYIDKSTLLLEYANTFSLYDIATKKLESIVLDTSFSDKTRGFTFRYYDSAKLELYFTEYFSGNYRYSLRTKKLTYLGIASNVVVYPPTYTYKIMPKGNNELWILTAAGIEVLNTQTGALLLINNDKLKLTSLINNNVYNGFIDRENNVWFGTVNGLSKLNSNALAIKSWSSEFSTSETNGLMSITKGNDENIYASVYFGKAYQVNTNNNKVSELQHPLNIGNWCLFANKNEIIRTGKGTSLLSYNTTAKQFSSVAFLKKYYPTSELIVLGLLHSNGDEWYSANKGGGFVRKLANGKGFKTYKKDDSVNVFSSTYYTTYTEDKNGDLWFGVNKTSTLLHWNIKTDRFNEIVWENIPSVKNKIMSGINAIAHDAENNIWIGFLRSGLVKYNPVSNEAVHYSIADGLSSSQVQGLQFDNANRLWVLTPKGLCCFIPSENKFINLKKEDGLPDDYFTDNASYFDAKKNVMWLGSNSTLMQFIPDELLKLSKANFPVYVDEIFINGKRYEDTIQDNLSLKPSDNNLLFRFVAVDVNKGKDIEYSYKLMGADKEWNNSGENQTASYANLNAGNYTFLVRARHKGDNVWNEIATPLYFHISTHWYKTWWFYTLLILATGFLIWFFIRSYYVRKLEKEKAILDKQHAIEQERTRLARELHDGLGSMLSGIKHSFSAIKSNVSLDEKQTINFDSSIEKLNTSIKEIRNLSHSMMDSDSLLRDGLINALKDYCRNINNPSALEVSFNAVEIDNLLLKEEQAFHLLRITQELIQNIIKHAQATKVIVQIHSDNDMLHLTVEDNGVGFDTLKTNLKKGIGFKNIQARLKIIAAVMDVQSIIGKGTSIYIQCPISVSK